MSSFVCKKLVISSSEKKLVDISFEINKSLALVGQSGSGKSLSLKSLLNLIPNSLDFSLEVDAEFELSRGKNITLVPQNPFTSFSPLTSIIKHFDAPLEKCKELMGLVGLSEELLFRFPPELSGGQLQRVAIALALLPSPKLLLLDEPTTALDTNSKQIIIDLILHLQEIFNFKMLFVSHDIKSVKKVCEDIIVLKNGTVVESGKMKDILEKPTHPYTIELIQSGFDMREKRS